MAVTEGRARSPEERAERPAVAEVRSPAAERPRPGLRLATAVAAALALLSMGAALLLPGELRAPAVVEAARTFRLEALPSGRYRLSWVDRSAPSGPTVVQERVFRLDRTDLVDLELAPGIASGARVEAGAVLARIRSPQHERRLERLRAEREALEAERRLLEAGGRPEDVRAALRRIEVARARRAEIEAELERARALAGTGAISAAEVEELELRERVRAAQVELEQALLDAARRPTRTPDLDRLDAELRAAEARVAEIEALVEADVVTAPFAGLVELGGLPDAGGARPLLQVHDTTSATVRFFVPAARRGALEPGTPVRLRTAAGEWAGVLVGVAPELVAVGGRPGAWATARIEPDELPPPPPGTTGEVRVRLRPGAGLDRLFGS